MIDNLTGKLLGQYDVLEEIGRGGMGVVYKARDRTLDRLVALKILGESLARDEAFLARFKLEARAAARLSHPGIVTVYAISESEGLHFIAMEYVQGRELNAIIAECGRLKSPDALGIALQVASALSAAHAEGIIHRDIKPQNIMVTAVGLTKVTDFGVAKVGAAAATSSLTQPGTMLGTPAYMAPEQCMGEPVDGRADVYALGIVLYQMLAGRLPFDGETPAVTIQRLLNDPPPPISVFNRSIPRGVIDLLDRMLEKDPAQRIASASALEQQIRRVMDRIERVFSRPLEQKTIVIDRDKIAALLPPSEPRRLQSRWKSVRFKAFAAGVCVAVAALAAIALVPDPLPPAPVASIVSDEVFSRPATDPPEPTPEPYGQQIKRPEIQAPAEPLEPGTARGRLMIRLRRRPELEVGLIATETPQPPRPPAQITEPKPPPTPTPSARLRLESAIDLYTGVGGKIDEARTRETILALAEQADPIALMWAAWFHRWRRCGFSRDDPGAERLARAAMSEVRSKADGADPMAMFLLGAALDQATGTDPDSYAAIRWLRKAAEAGQTTAMNYLGWMLSQGRGAEKNDAEAAGWFRRSAELGDVAGMHNLGWMYADGRGVDPNPGEAARWFRRGAQAGSPRNMNNLALMFEQGRGVGRSDAQALLWMQRAAEAGDDRAMYNIGSRFEAGRGVPRNRDLALSWYRQAAQAGNEAAREKLRSGFGSP